MLYHNFNIKFILAINTKTAKIREENTRTHPHTHPHPPTSPHTHPIDKTTDQELSLPTEMFILESCGARFLAPRTGIAPLSFAPTRTGPKNCKFYGPDPGPTRLYFPRTGPDRNSLASTRNLKVSTRTDPKILKYGKYFVLRSKRSNQVSDYNKHVNMPFNKVITSNNVLIKDNNHSTSSVWE